MWGFLGPREKMVPRNAHRATSGAVRLGGSSKGFNGLRILEAVCWRHQQADHRILSCKRRAKADSVV